MAGRPPLPRGVYNFEDLTQKVPSEVLLDTSFVVAVLNVSEPKHRECVDFLQRLTDEQSLLVYNRLLEVELAEVAFKLAVKERHGSRGWPSKRNDGRVRRRAGRIMKGFSASWRDIVDTRPSLCVEVEEVAGDVPDGMHGWGLGSYDAVHAATAVYAATSLVTLDAGFAAVPERQLTIYTDSSRVSSCRRRRGGRAH